MTHIDYNGPATFDIHYPVVIVGGGGCGLCAALAVRDAGLDVLILERDSSLMGTTAMSTGLIPAAGTPEQTANGIDDSPTRFADDIRSKTNGQIDDAVVSKLAETSAETVAWLRDVHSVNLDLLDGFLYPGHSAMRMYGMPNRSGGELMAALESAAEKADVDILTDALADTLYVGSDDRIRGIKFIRPDGESEVIGCGALILASCGFAGEPTLVEKYIPEMSKGVFHGHPGNKGHAIKWGDALGAKLDDMSAYQGHGGLAYGHGIPILWPLIMEGGFQVNCEGQRFSDETQGYSEQAVKILAQPDSVAWSIFDETRHELMLKFDDYQEAIKAGAIKSASTINELADLLGLPREALSTTIKEAENSAIGDHVDKFGRNFSGKEPLTAPYYAAKVTGALFHTQGGLAIDENARVLREDKTHFPNLFAGGGAARGISGPGASGYIAGNGLLTATSLGKLAGRNAAQLIQLSERE